MQRDRIASAALSYRLRVDRRGAVLADQPLCGLVVTDGAADFARIEHGCDLAIRLLIKQESHGSPVDLCRVAMQVTIGDLRLRDRRLAIHERDLGRRRKGSGALRVDKLRSYRSNKD